MNAYAEELFTPRAAHADEFAAAALDAIKSLPAGSRVLDIGCGSGDLIRRAQRPRVSFVGVDISRPNIETAKASGGAEFHCADFLQFDDGQFNVVFANSVLHLIDGPNTTVAAALSRTIQPHGLLVAAMPIDTAYSRLLAFQRRLWSVMPQRLDRWIGSAVSSILKDASVVERLVYLRMPPTRLLGTGFSEAMERNSFRLASTHRMHADHPLKLQHSIATWRKVTDDF
jgi:SAM-dependent methyltransferase